MTTTEFLSKIEELDLTRSSKVKLKKFWSDRAPSIYNIGSANFMGEDLVFHASEYGDLKLDKVLDTIKENDYEGIIRVGSFRIHYIQPTLEGFNLVIRQNPKNVSNLGKWFFNIF